MSQLEAKSSDPASVTAVRSLLLPSSLIATSSIKTLVFAKTDSHADDIIQTVREEFAEGNKFL